LWAVPAPGQVSRHWQRWLVWCGIAGPALVAVIAVVAAIRSPGYSPLSDTISDLAAQDAPHSLVMRTGLVIFGLLTIAFAAGLAASIAVRARFLQLLIALFGLCIVLLGIFQDYSEVPGAPRNREGYLHNSFGLIAIASLLGAMIVLGSVAREDPRWRPFAEVNRVTLLIVLITATLFLRGPKETEGLYELVLFGAALVWMARIALSVLSPPQDHTVSADLPATGPPLGAAGQDSLAHAPSPGDG
jgi:hypothetical membrane protein